MERPPQVQPQHLTKSALVYIRQSSMEQVRNNSGSTDVQRQLAARARQWGWPDSRITIIDGDLGISGSHPGRRQAFQHMLDLMDRGEVSIVFVNDASRLSRNPLDAEQFLRIATARGVLVEVNGKLYSPGDAEIVELLNLRMQNLFAWWFVANQTRIFREAKRAKVAQGFAVTRPPDGFVTSVRGKWVQDPDIKIRHLFRRAFELYLPLGSAKKVARYLNER